MVKAYCGELVNEVMYDCLQFHGGIGYTWEHDQHLYLRRLTTDAGLFGDASWHRQRWAELGGY